MAEKMPLFSICIPNYNYENYLGATIDSVLDQSFEDFEIVIQDNASTDGSWDLIQSYAKKDKRIRAYQNTVNVGFAPNLQKVTENARGEFIILLSSDDKMKPEALASYAMVIKDSEDKESLILCADVDIIDEEDKTIGFIQKRRNDYAISTCTLNDSYDKGAPEELDLDKFLKTSLTGKIPRTLSIFCAFAYSRKLWERVCGYDTTKHFSPDFAFSLKLLEMRPTYFWVHERFFEYRIHANNQTSLQKKMGNLKMELDGYFYVKEFSDKFLKEFNLDRTQVTKTYINGVLLYGAIIKIYVGNWIEAFRLYHLAWALFPLETIRLSKTYIALSALIFGIIYAPIKRAFSK